jgi:hypothetical protein
MQESPAFPRNKIITFTGVYILWKKPPLRIGEISADALWGKIMKWGREKRENVREKKKGERKKEENGEEKEKMRGKRVK